MIHLFPIVYLPIQVCNEYVELLNAKVSPTESPPFPIPAFQCVCEFIFFPFPQQSGLFLDLCIFMIHSHCVGHYLKRQGPHILWFYDIFWVITSHTGIKSYYMNTLKSVSFSRYLTLILKIIPTSLDLCFSIFKISSDFFILLKLKK